MQISPNSQSIQLLKAQQAWEARRANTQTQSEPIEPDNTDIATASVPQQSLITENNNTGFVIDRQSLVSNPALSAQWTRKVQDIQQTAQKAGFVGISEQDIQHAFLSGQSLLADYKV